MCGKLNKFNRFKVVKDLIIQKLDDTLSKLSSLDTIERGITHLAENESVFFKSLTYLTNEFQQFQQFLKQTEQSLKESLTETKQSLKESLTETEQSLKESFVYQLEEGGLKKILTKLEDNAIIKIKSSSEDSQTSIPEPDVRLMAFLYSFLPHRVALDVGANIGNVSEILLDSGYEVYAFEPYIPTFAKLTSRLNNHPGFHPIDCAVGFQDGEIDLYIAADTSGQNFYQEPSLYNTLSPHSMPPGLEFTDKISVSVRSIQSLQESGKIPNTIGLLKIDAEGYDLEVIRGSGNGSIPIIVSEFWDEHHVFAKFDAFNSLRVLVEEMRARNYYWYIVVARKENKNSPDFIYDVLYYCNFPQTLENSWGNVFFFNEYELFKKALDWCSAMLPMAHFQ